MLNIAVTVSSPSKGLTPPSGADLLPASLEIGPVLITTGARYLSQWDSVGLFKMAVSWRAPIATLDSSFQSLPPSLRVQIIWVG